MILAAQRGRNIGHVAGVADALEGIRAAAGVLQIFHRGDDLTAIFVDGNHQRAVFGEGNSGDGIGLEDIGSVGLDLRGDDIVADLGAGRIIEAQRQCNRLGDDILDANLGDIALGIVGDGRNVHHRLALLEVEGRVEQAGVVGVFTGGLFVNGLDFGVGHQDRRAAEAIGHVGLADVDFARAVGGNRDRRGRTCGGAAGGIVIHADRGFIARIVVVDNRGPGLGGGHRLRLNGARQRHGGNERNGQNEEGSSFHVNIFLF